jgi:hypothetical protein
MDEIVVKIMVELLSTLARATKKLQQGRSSMSVLSDVFYLTERNTVRSVEKRSGEMDVEVVLQRLDRLTLDEARVTAAETLDATYGLIRNMKVAMDGKQTRLTCHPPSVDYLPSRRRGVS